MTRLGAAMPSIGGEGWLLPSFLAPVLGGTLLSGGALSVIGTVLGAALVTTIRSGLLVMQIGNFWLQLFLGMILLLAVMADRYRGVYAERLSAGAAMRAIASPAHHGRMVGAAGGDRHRLGGARAGFAPAFLTEFNIYVMLRSFCVGLLVGFAQMVTLGVGQMNISVGALGGLVAISAGGMMEVLGFPLIAGGAARASHRSAGRADQRAADRADRHQRLHHHARHRLGLHRHQSRHHGVDPVLSSVAGAGGLRRGAGRARFRTCSWRR